MRACTLPAVSSNVMFSLASLPVASLLLASAPIVAANPITSHAQLTPRQSTLSCPASNGTTFTSSAGTAFIVECNTDRQGNDMGLTYASGLDSCINSCSTTNGCVDVSWVTSNGFCYLKNSLSTPQTNSGVYGARLVAAPQPSAAPTAISCPASNGQPFVANGQTFTLECFLDHTGGDTGLTYQSTYAGCVSNCAATSGCLAASWVASNGFCYVKNVLNTANTNSGVWGARLGAATTSTSAPPSPASSTSTSASTSTSKSTSAPTSASTSSSTSAPTSVSTSASTSASVSTPTSIPSSTSISNSTSTTTSSTATPTVIGTSGSLTCPGSHGSRYIDASGTNFLIECYTDRQGADIHNQNANNLTACMSACANYPGCVDATYVVSQTQCWMKGHLQIPVNGNTDLVNARIVSPASLSPNPTVYSTPQYPGYAGIKYWFAFGDSYSADSFDFNGVQPGPGNPTGNPGSPYATTASGPNYLIYLANVNSSSPIYLYDMANIGAIVDPTAFGYGPQLAHPQIQQVAYDWLETYVDNPSVPWTAQNSMFSQFFGINDCDDLYGLDANTQALYMAADLAAYRAQMELVSFLHTPFPSMLAHDMTSNDISSYRSTSKAAATSSSSTRRPRTASRAGFNSTAPRSRPPSRKSSRRGTPVCRR